MGNTHVGHNKFLVVVLLVDQGAMLLYAMAES